MKNWFLQLSSRQSTNVYIITIFISGLSFLFIPLTGISFVIWLATLVLIVKETKLIKQKKYESNENNSKKCACNEPPIVPTVVSESEETVEQPAHSPVFNVTIKTEYVKREPVGELSHLDFGKPYGELGCFLNFQYYWVSGINSEGKRRQKKCSGANAQEAIDEAAKFGLSPPYKASPIEYYTPTDRQLEYLGDLGVLIPDGITNIDASYMLSRIEDNEEAPSTELVALATDLKVKFSAFTGNSSLFCQIVYTDNHRDRAALYAYAVHQSMSGYSFGNMLEDPNCPQFYAFADKVLAEPALMRSLLDRKADDFLKPYRGTAIYKAAAAFITTMDK